MSKDVIVCQNISKSFDTARGVVDDPDSAANPP